MVTPVERLRRRWSPEREAVKAVHDLAPGTELDSMLRDFLHRICEQRGPQTVTLGFGGEPVLNTGTLRWEIVHHQPVPGVSGRREVSLWIEKSGP